MIGFDYVWNNFAGIKENSNQTKAECTKNTKGGTAFFE